MKLHTVTLHITEHSLNIFTSYELTQEQLVSSMHSKEIKKPSIQKMSTEEGMLTLRFPLKKGLGWKDKPNKESQWENLINETCIFDFLLHDPILGIIDDYDGEAVDIYNAIDLTRGARVNSGAMSLNIEAIKSIYVLENWYVYGAKQAVNRVKNDKLDELTNDFAAWHARCILKLSPFLEEWSIAEMICMLEDDIDMCLEDGSAYLTEEKRESTKITEKEVAQLAEVVKNIKQLYEQQKINEDFPMMLAESILRIADIIGNTTSIEGEAVKDLQCDRDLYDLAMMQNDFLKDSLDMLS